MRHPAPPPAPDPGARARHRWVVAAALALVVVVVAVVLLGSGHSRRRPAVAAAPAPDGALAADGTPLGEVPGMGELAARLAVVHPSARGPVRTAVDPELQRALLAALPGGATAGVVVGVGDGRLRAAAGAGGASPWRTQVAPGAVVEPALAAAAIDVRDLPPAEAVRALDPDDDGAAQALAIRTSAFGVEDVLRRAGLQTPARAADLAGLARPGAVPAIGTQLTEGVGRAAAFRDADGSYRDVQVLARASAVGLAQVALGVASGGLRRDLGVSQPARVALEPLWLPRAAREVTRALTSRVVRGRVPGLAAPIAGTSDAVAPAAGRAGAATLIAWAPARAPRAAIALVATGRTASPRRLGVTARAVLAAALR